MVDQTIDYNRLIWDRLEGIPAPAEHSNIFGHEQPLNILTDSYKKGKMHHSWLVSGPRGVGKATLSLAVAGHILRNPQPNDAPETFVKPTADDVVSSLIAKGGHPNILHLSRPYDAKTKKFSTMLNVDEIRRTVSFFGTTRAQDNWRICIVDSADDMNTSAANALLKILEEPPSRTVFFILANSPGRLLPTIRSRCRHLPLRPLDNKNLQSALVALGVETSNLNERQLQQLYKLSDGSVRRALVLLKQDGLKLLQRFNEILGTDNNPTPDWPQAHKLAEELSRVNKDEHYRMLLDITADHVSDMLSSHAQLASVKENHSLSQNQAAQSQLSALARMCEVWDKIAANANLADSYNLDRKQVILNLFGSLAKARQSININQTGSTP
ncbi:MAG: DNA polymerase III subunit delta' [Rhizobiaceae bacterium]|nr:DNA polymerase III subunit delta' [Rhizobiaceae bacterium]